VASSYLNQFASPVVKLVRFFERSRDGWKAKYVAKKKQCKFLTNQTRAVEKSRECWRERALLAQKQLVDLQQEFEALKCNLTSPG
jgi:hypothetical protein